MTGVLRIGDGRGRIDCGVATEDCGLIGDCRSIHHKSTILNESPIHRKSSIRPRTASINPNSPLANPQYTYARNPRSIVLSARGRSMDPRLYQIATLASLLVYGMGWLEFDITARPRGAAAGDGPRHAGRRRPARGPGRQLEERAHLGPLALPAAAHQRRRPWRCSPRSSPSPASSSSAFAASTSSIRPTAASSPCCC